MGVMYLDFVHSSTVTSDIFSMAWSVTAKFRQGRIYVPGFV